MTISREEALKAITAFVENYACGTDLDGLREAIKALKEQRPHGEWKQWSIDPRFNLPTYKCSICGLIVANIDSSMNYCGNCGADMREGEQNERKNNTETRL